MSALRIAICTQICRIKSCKSCPKKSCAIWEATIFKHPSLFNNNQTYGHPRVVQQHPSELQAGNILNQQPLPGCPTQHLPSLYRGDLLNQLLAPHSGGHQAWQSLRTWFKKRNPKFWKIPRPHGHRFSYNASSQHTQLNNFKSQPTLFWTSSCPPLAQLRILGVPEFQVTVDSSDQRKHLFPLSHEPIWSQRVKGGLCQPACSQVD